MHNLCVQMSWYTLESLEEPERLGCLSGDWFVEGADVRKREELQMVRLMAGLGTSIRLMLRPEWVDGVKLQMICGLIVVHRNYLSHAVNVNNYSCTNLAPLLQLPPQRYAMSSSFSFQRYLVTRGVTVIALA